MRTTWIVLALLGGLASAKEQWVQSPVNGHWYARTQYAYTWHQAEVYAQSFGGHLATLRSAAESVWLELQFGASGWIGFSDVVAEGSWSWSSAAPVTYTDWGAGEPNDFGGVEDAACFYPYGGWNDENPLKLTRAYLEVDGPQPDPGDAQAFLGAWHQSPVSGLWYARSQVGLERGDAAALAAATAGHLATVHGPEEDAWLRATFTDPLSALWIGLDDAAVEGKWTWADGTPLTYTHWSPGEPNDSGGDEDYAVLLPSGKWADLAGHLALPALVMSLNPPGATIHGQGCAGSGGFVPKLLVTEGIPQGGTQLSVTLLHGLGGSVMFLFFSPDTGDTPLGHGCLLNIGVPYPLALGPLALGGSGAGNGTLTLFGTLPAFQAPVSVAMQAFVLDPFVVKGYSNTWALVLHLTP